MRKIVKMAKELVNSNLEKMPVLCEMASIFCQLTGASSIRSVV